MSPKSDPEPRQPHLGAAQIRLLERLCNAVAVSGDEGEVRLLVLENVRPLADEVSVDALGNVLAIRRARGENASGQPPLRSPLRVMLAAHMDEVGFMLTNDDGDGIFRFELVGGLDERQLVGKPVWIGREHVPGVIGAKPIHLTTAEERKLAISLDSLRMDTGPGGNSKVKVGDRATFATTFTRLGPSLRAKALDDRLGVATLIELLRHAPAHLDLMAAFTVQEEVGLRGARVAAYAFNPDLAVAIDSTPAMDLPVWEREGSQPEENAHYNTRLDAGPAIYLADGYTLSDPRLVSHLVQTAEALGIPYQFRQPSNRGGTDAGAIHLSRAGIPSVSVSVPGRYAHTAAGLARLSDWQNTFTLLHAALDRLPADILAVER
ncbi:MAG TPA: M20/M25/M40 family metallo-hydrolase [Anaerolineales bacterium]|nr:M20/M25/M40 family metallo-hydrolase [Anaerolineales bacterium]